jgi:hypothetical protein
MVAMVQRLNASGLFFCTQLSVSTFLALVLKVCRNRFRCHGHSVAELSPSNLSNFGHFDRLKEVAFWEDFISQTSTN